MKRFAYILFLLPLTFLSCETDNMFSAEALGQNISILGTWIEGDIDATSEFTQLLRADSLDEFKYGFIFDEDGSFTERKNAGWCGTPPIYYDNFEGQWTALNDSLLDITVAYWGGTMTYQIRILSLDDVELQINYLFEDERVDVP